MLPYADPKPEFQGGTSPEPLPAALGVWLATAGVGLLVAETAANGSPLWLSATALLALGLAGLALRLLPRSSGRALAMGSLGVALTLGTAAWRTHRVTADGERMAELAAADAAAARDRLVSSAVAGARRVASNALQRTLTSTPRGAAPLEDLISGGTLEQGLVVLGGDTVIAIAGPQRAPALTNAGGLTLVTTPFARLLVVTENRDRRQVQVTLLLDAEPALPSVGKTLSHEAGNWQRVRWLWEPAPAVIPLSSATHAATVIDSMMHAVVPDPARLVARERMVAGWLAVAGMSLLAVFLLLTVAPPAMRAIVVLMPAWVVVRAGLITGALSQTAITGMLAAAVLLVIAVALWRRPARRSPMGVVAAALLLATAPPLVALAGAALAPDTPGGLVTWFTWQAVLALGATALLAVAAAPLRSAGDENVGWRWGIIATILAAVVGVIGIVAWTPAPLDAQGWDAVGWLPWYIPLWLLPLAALLPVTSPRARRLALATTGATLAALSAWSATLDRRMVLAHDDLVQLATPTDSIASSALADFGDIAMQQQVASLDQLFVVWRSSQLYEQQVPSQLAVWVGGEPVEWIALDTLSAFWNDLDSVVSAVPVARRQVSLARGTGRHELLVLPMGGDTVMTALIGPRSLVIQPTRFGRLIAWRTPPQPPYTLDEISAVNATHDGVFRRRGRFVRADTIVSAGARPAVVLATVRMSTPQPFAVRAALTVLLDVGVTLLAWLLADRMLGGGGLGATGMFRRSYRRTMAAALTAFFVVPAAFFSLWSALRLRQDVARERNVEVARALRDIVGDDAFTPSLLEAPQSETLAQIAARVDAELGVYRRGRLVSASAPLLADLGLLSPIIDPRVVPTSATETRELARPVPGANVRVGVEPTAVEATLIAAALPAAAGVAEQEQVDLALLLLLASLGGTAAAVVVAGLVARALGQPIEMLRVRAVAIGRREPAPPLRAPPAEFEPVFAAIADMEDDLRASEARLESETARTSRIVAWGEMARQVAHEIKNPLTPMRLGLQHLRRIGIDDPAQLPQQLEDTVQRLLLQIERLDRIARSFARYGTPPERESGPLESLDLAAVCAELAALFALADARPRVVVEGTAPAPVAARREELLQVLLNLLDNAREAGARTVRLALSPGRLDVIDDGRGILPEQLDRIFEPTFSTTTSGTGLGLAIVRRLAESWGAKVTVVSRPPEGTTFSMHFATGAGEPAGSTPPVDPA